jgi:hypothetical protein
MSETAPTTTPGAVMGRLPSAPLAMSKTFCVEAKTVGPFSSHHSHARCMVCRYSVFLASRSGKNCSYRAIDLWDRNSGFQTL